MRIIANFLINFLNFLSVGNFDNPNAGKMHFNRNVLFTVFIFATIEYLNAGNKRRSILSCSACAVLHKDKETQARIP